MAYQRVTSSDTFNSGATAATTVINAIETGLEAAETTIASHTTSIATNATAITTETTRATAAELNGLSWSRGYGRFANITQTLAEGTDSFALCVLSDSTGVGTARWPYLVAQSLATSYPAYTVHVRNWNDTNQDYDAPIVLQTGTAGARYITHAGTYSASNEGDDTTLNGVIDVRLKLTLATWTAAADIALVSRYYGGARVFSLQLTTSGTLAFYYTTDGNTQAGGNTSTVATGFGAGTTNWVRCVFTPDNGSAQKTYQYYTSSDGVTWTQLGSTVTVAGAVTLYQPPTFADATPVGILYEVGARGGSAAVAPSGTLFYEVEIRNGLNGPLVTPRYLEHWNKQTATSYTTSGAPILTLLNSSVSGQGIGYFNEIRLVASARTTTTLTMGSVTGLYVGQTVTGAGIPNGTTIASISGTVLTMSQTILTAGDNNIIFTPSSRLALMCPTGYEVRNIFIASSHNEAYSLGKAVWGRWNSVIKQIKTRLPQVPITVIAQNPETSAASYYNEHNRRCKMMANIAAANDASFIDVYQAFRNSSTALSSLVNSDGIHPSDASGSPLWRDTVLAFLTNKA